MNKKYLFAGVLMLQLAAATCLADVVEKHLTISTKQVKFGGRTVEALAVNNSIPAPTLRFTEGDTVVIKVTNNLKESSSVHWHGILLPNRMDGVPNMTYPPIGPGESFTYRFTLRQSGTYWYHSHSGLQEQRGLYGAFIIEPKQKTLEDTIPDNVLVLSDWTNQPPSEVMHTLKRGSEWFSIRKHSSQSLLGALRVGAIGNYFKRELSRMPSMDISDIYYDAFLINGRRQTAMQMNSSDPLRLRIINGSASTFFYLQFAGRQMQVISADGQPVVPFETKQLLIGVAETYDLIVHPEPGRALEFRATPHDNTSKASLWIGRGKETPAPEIAWPNMYKAGHSFDISSLVALTPAGAMQMDGSLDKTHSNHNMHHDSHSTMHHSSHQEPLKTVSQQPNDLFGLMSEDLSSHSDLSNDVSDRSEAPYSMLKSPVPTNFDPSRPVREVRLTLDGDMKRYVWMLNNKVMSEADSIKINAGEVVRFVMVNRTMMYHPMHLHGHFFRVLNKHGDYSPLKHTVIVAPMQTTTIEFDAAEQGDWFFHCHLLYHMMSGMARMVHYNQFTPPDDVDQSSFRLDHYYYLGHISALSNMAQGHAQLSNARNIFSLEWQAGWRKVAQTEWEATPLYEYYVNRFMNIFAGADLDGSDTTRDSAHAVAGLRYLLPLNIESRHWLDSDLGYQLALAKSFDITPRLHLYSEAEYDIETLWELRSGAEYMLSRDFALQTQWHSDFGWGAGLQFSF